MKRLYLILLLVPILLWGTACQLKQAVLLPLPESSKAPIRDRYVFLINMDGSRPSELHKWIADGSLPHMQNLFIENGAVFENAINVFPTVSIPNHQAFISGLFPGHHGVPALDWFSRPLERHMDFLKPKDMYYTPVLMFNFLQVLQKEIITDAPQTIFDQLTGHPTLAIMESTAYGASLHLPKSPPPLVALDFQFRQQYQTVDFLAMDLVLKHLKKAPQAQLPRFSFINFFGMDNMAHFEGPDSQSCKDMYILYDRFLGELVATLKDRGIWEKSTLVLVSDHGQHYLNEIVSLPQILDRIGLKVDSMTPTKGQVVWGDHGTGTSNLYFKVGNDWSKRPSYEQIRDFTLESGQSIDLVESLLEQFEIEMVILPEDPLTTHLFTKGHHARIQRQYKQGEFWYRYIPDSEQDPVHYLKDPKIAALIEAKKFYDAETWLQATAAAELPDVIVGLPQLFDDRRTGDMVVQTPKEMQFKESKLSGHGSLHQEDRRVNLMLYGPDIKPGRYLYARITDTYPTLLTIFGLKSPMPMDGKVRTEIFNDPTLIGATKQWPSQYTAIAPEAFEKYLHKQSQRSDLSAAEKDKIQQLLFDMNFYQDTWRLALETDSRTNQGVMATGLIKEKPIQNRHGLSTSPRRRHLDSPERGNLPQGH